LACLCATAFIALYLFRSSTVRPQASLKNEKCQHSTVSTEGVYTEKLNPPGTCILDPSKMPDSWKSPEGLEFQDSGKPWSKEEQELANTAAQKGLDELVDFYNTISVQRIQKLYTNAANSLIDECFSSANMPEFHDQACKEAARVINIIAEDFVSNEEISKRCGTMHYKVKMLVYANYLSKTLPGDAMLKKTRNSLSRITQASLDACGNLSNYLEVKDWEADLKNPRLPRAVLRDYVHASNMLTDLYTVPELELPEELDRFTAQLWKYVANYNFTYARDVKNGYADPYARHVAYLVTHVAYMPTGYGRHMQYVKDAPWLFKYIRENYYAALEEGGLDLYAEFVDIIRQYGCNEDNDLMVRHGSRYLLDLYVKAGNSWMNYREDPDDVYDDYDLIHMPWTAISGVIRRQVEPVVPGSFGYGFWKALERAGAADLQHVK